MRSTITCAFAIAAGFVITIPTLSISRADDESKAVAKKVANDQDEIDRALENFAERVDRQVEIRNVTIAVRQADDAVKKAEAAVRQAQEDLASALETQTSAREPCQKVLQDFQRAVANRRRPRPELPAHWTTDAQISEKDELRAMIRTLQAEITALKAEVSSLKSNSETAKETPNKN